ncbi:MAG: type II toxin-antitoxin system ParD family antitoxin [Acidobacteria bacterium]|nr:type II toxin-antitoxin system ParD family antitoxin [Acidobacteriota bacterium]
MTSMNISLPEELKAYVEQQTSGGYSTPSEYVRQLIREDQRRCTRDRLEQLLLDGLDSGEPVPADERFWTELKREAVELMRVRGKGPKANRK